MLLLVIGVTAVFGTGLGLAIMVIAWLTSDEFDRK
jgi:hypothetical protein